MKQNLCIFDGHVMWSFLVHFKLVDFMRTFLSHQMTQWSGLVSPSHTMYIYSLGHFLTTKGALIDGDWGGSKNYPKTQKSDQKFPKKIKITQNRSKNNVKK